MPRRESACAGDSKERETWNIIDNLFLRIERAGDEFLTLPHITVLGALPKDKSKTQLALLAVQNFLHLIHGFAHLIHGQLEWLIGGHIDA